MSRVKAQGAACHRVKYLTTGSIPGVLRGWGGKKLQNNGLKDSCLQVFACFFY